MSPPLRRPLRHVGELPTCPHWVLAIYMRYLSSPGNLVERILSHLQRLYADEKGRCLIRLTGLLVQCPINDSVTYLDDGVRQVYRTERVTVVVSDQEMIGAESVLQLEPIPMKSATFTFPKVKHTQSIQPPCG